MLLYVDSILKINCIGKYVKFKFLSPFFSRSAKGFMHMRIKRDTKTREFQLSDFERKFVTIPEMVYHYTRNRLPIKGAEHMCLKKPIPIQLL